MVVAVLVVFAAQLHSTQSAARRDVASRFRDRAAVTSALTQAIFSSAAASPDAAKEYGTANRLEGPYEDGECVCIVEDVVTSGGALLDSLEALRGAGLVVHTAVCVVDREEGGADALARHAVRLRTLFRASDLLR